MKNLFKSHFSDRSYAIAVHIGTKPVTTVFFPYQHPQQSSAYIPFVRQIQQCLAAAFFVLRSFCDQSKFFKIYKSKYQ
jgi:hypothetical protein